MSLEVDQNAILKVFIVLKGRLFFAVFALKVGGIEPSTVQH